MLVHPYGLAYYPLYTHVPSGRHRESTMPAMIPENRDSQPDEIELKAKVLEVLERIRPSVQEDGGDVELVSVSADGDVQIRFLGACIGCPSSEITLQEGIARNLRENIPQVRDVIAIE